MVLLRWRQKNRENEAAAPSFADLALPLLPSLYNLARWLTRDAAAAEDLVQESLLKALRGFESFETGTNFKAWIFRILRNAYLTSRSGLAAMRTVALEEELEEDSTVPESIVNRRTPEAEVIRMRDADALHAAMEKLPPPLLEVLLLCDVEEMKYREIAMVVGIPIGTVMSRVARARAFVRKELQSQWKPTREVGR
ncbi:MAG TPA: sigma-70 family RNA polymerase sigma factor [Acidobacteriaceae bacterium]|jgi:RNA polymerase sigma-70 factor (ECF subfamily)|nr:sigma-70 family RNA polymerase sigma factor [Acidobacteriaceae bacterium]